MSNQQYNYNNNNNGCNNSMTLNNGGQTNNVTRSTLRRTSPTIPQHNSSSVASTSPIPVVSSTPSTHSTIMDTVIPGQSIANSIISGTGGGS